MDVENVFRTILATPSAVNEYLLCQKTAGICDLYSCLVCERETIGHRESNGPGPGQKDLNVAQILRRDAAYALCCFRFPAPADGTAWKRRHEFCVKLNTGISKAIVGGWRLVVSKKFGFKSV